MSITDNFDLNEYKAVEGSDKVFEKMMLEHLEDSDKTPGEAIEEGMIGGILGGMTSAMIAPGIMKSICKVLGISENGTLGQLLTSKLVLGAVGAHIGSKM